MNPSQHDSLTQKISRDVAQAVERGERVHIHKGGVSHFVPLPGDQRRHGAPIDISGLRNVLEIDVQGRTCIAEPGVTFADCVRETLKHGLLPMVVPELEGITLGGAVAGCSVESMSFRYGGFHDSCLEYEIVTGTGELLRCSREQNPHSFEMIHGSYGTLGILTRLKFKLVPAKPYVRLEYRRYERFEDFERAMYEHCHAHEGGGSSDLAFDFIDAIFHGPKHLVLCLGQFVEQAPRVSSYRGTEIYYKSTAKLEEDYLTTFDYLFRYDTECHWLSRTIPPLEWKPVRAALGKLLLGSTNMIRWSKRMEKLVGLKKRPDVVCDVFIPQNNFRAFFDWYCESFDYWPLWIVPYRAPEIYGWVGPEHRKRMAELMPQGFMIDCAVYGKSNGEPDVDYSELLERKTYELHGLKTLISANHHTPEKFWSVFNRENYDAAKRTLDPQGLFPRLYEKFHPGKRA